MENRPPKWNIKEAQKKAIEGYKQAQKPVKQKKPQQSSSNGSN